MTPLWRPKRTRRLAPGSVFGQLPMQADAALGLGAIVLVTPGEVLRTVNVSTAAQLIAALNAAIPGDWIEMAAGIYSGNFTGSKIGTATHHITLHGPPTAIINGGGMGSGYTFYLNAARWWVLSGFTITGGQKGLMMDAAFDNIMDGLEVHHVGSELVHFRTGSSRNTLKNSHVHHSGQVGLGHFGEGVYIGSSNVVPIDQANDNIVFNNLIEDVTAEGVEIKENTRRNIVTFNTINRSGKGLNADGTSSAFGAIGWRTGNSIISDNLVNNDANGPQHGLVIYSGGGAGDGDNNTVRRNILHVNNVGYGIKVNGTQVGNDIGCDNVVTGAASGFSNVACTP